MIYLSGVINMNALSSPVYSDDDSTFVVASCSSLCVLLSYIAFIL